MFDFLNQPVPVWAFLLLLVVLRFVVREAENMLNDLRARLAALTSTDLDND